MPETGGSKRWPDVVLGSAGGVWVLLGCGKLLGQAFQGVGVQGGAGARGAVLLEALLGSALGISAVALASSRRRSALATSSAALAMALVMRLGQLLQGWIGAEHGSTPWVSSRTEPFPGWLAPAALLSLSLCATAILILGTGRRNGVFPVAAVSASMGSALALVPLLGYALNIESAAGWGGSTGMTLQASATLLMLGTALLLRCLLDPETRARRAPRWLPLPVAAGGLVAVLCLWRSLAVLENDAVRWVRSFLFGEETVLEEHLPELVLATGIAIVVLLTMAIYFGQSAAIRGSERKQALRALRKAHEELERRVERRTAEVAKVNERLQEEIRSRERLEAMLRQRAEMLSEADRKKDEFLAMLGHELRNPLATLSRGLENMERVRPDHQVFDETRQAMKRRLTHLVRLVDDLLEVSRITSGKVRLRKKVLDFGSLVSGVADGFGSAFRERRISLSFHSPSAPVRVEGDEVRLEQIVSNLISNALKYTDEQGSVSLTLAREDDEAVLRVRDTGIGISEEHLPRVFDVFSQAGLSFDRAGSGLGVGLTLVHRLVTAHEGSVEVFSEGPGTGSEFVLRLPEVFESGLREELPGRHHVPSQGRLRRVLIVDDRADLLSMLGRLLASWGHQVAVAHNGRGALETAASDPPEVALIDVGLQGMDGYDLAVRLRSRSRAKPVLVAITGYSQPDHGQRAREAGFDHYLLKPVDLQELQGILDTACV